MVGHVPLLVGYIPNVSADAPIRAVKISNEFIRMYSVRNTNMMFIIDFVDVLALKISWSATFQ